MSGEHEGEGPVEAGGAQVSATAQKTGEHHDDGDEGSQDHDGGWAPSAGVDVGPPRDNLAGTFRLSSCWEGGSPGSCDRVAGVAAPLAYPGGVSGYGPISLPTAILTLTPLTPLTPQKGCFGGRKGGGGGGEGGGASRTNGG